MARLRCDFFSDTLGMSTSMTVLLPQKTSHFGERQGIPFNACGSVRGNGRRFGL